jgi:hypothetical protein
MRGRGESKHRKKLIFAGALFTLLLLTFHPTGIFAFADHLVINEIYPNQLSDGIDTEWAELYDPNAQISDLSNFSLVKVTSSGTEYKKQISGSICQKSDRYYVCNLGTNFLANSGATLVLKSNATEVDRVTFGSLSSNAPIPNQGQSISRIPDGQDSDVDSSDFQLVPTTKGSENILPPPVIYSDKIYISELLPQPATGSADEFIELYNSSDSDVDLKDWQLDSGYFSTSTIIKSKEYRVFKNPEIKIGLTDSGDTTRLIDPNGDILSTVTYTKSFRGQSYSLFDAGWQWTSSLTPGLPNILTTDSEDVPRDKVIQLSDITTARQKEDGDTVLISGTVSVIPGILSSQYFYIQDDLSGIQVYNYDKLFPILHPGDQVTVIGELSSISNERRVKTLFTSDITVIRQNSPPVPDLLQVSDLGEKYEGRLVEVQGTVSKTSGNTFYVGDGGEIEVIIRSQTGIVKPRMSRGADVKVSGILSQYQDGYRLLPISLDGVRILTSGMLPQAGSDPENNLRIRKPWTLRPSQPMRHKRLVTNLGKI